MENHCLEIFNKTDSNYFVKVCYNVPNKEVYIRFKVFQNYFYEIKVNKDNYKEVIDFFKEKRFLNKKEARKIKFRLGQYFRKKTIYKFKVTEELICPNCESKIVKRKNLYKCLNENCLYSEER